MTQVKENLRFVAHARLKDIVGRGLIMSDDIAIIELIKNSKDADSPSVCIKFRESTTAAGKTELLIADQGHGMSMEDIEHKWLNIAYSDKKKNKPAHGVYAGSKGIGRFSCDRLGSKLTLISRKKDNPYIRLDIDWTEFEVDQRDIDIGKIEFNAEQFSQEEFPATSGEIAFETGTILIIRHLRSHWDHRRIKSLRSELERIRYGPKQCFFNFVLALAIFGDNEINAPIENKIYDELYFRTTSIQADTINNGSKIRFELRHAGNFVFRSTEKNPYSQITDASLNLFFLNQPAKVFFNRKTGYRSVDYGSVFLFLNGFRVFPYGSAGDDWLGIQKRQGQGPKALFRNPGPSRLHTDYGYGGRQFCSRVK